MRIFKRTTKQMVCTFASVMTLLNLPACGCSEKKRNDEDAAVDAAADGEMDAMTDAWADGSVEAGRRDADPPDAFVFHDCMAPLEVKELKEGELYQVPIVREQGASHGGFAWNGRYLIQSDKRCEWPEYDVVLDLYGVDTETMEERLLVGRKRFQLQPSIYESSFVYCDTSFLDETDPDNNRRSEIMLYDLITQEETRLTDSNEGKTQPRFNGTHVLYMNFHYTGEYESFETLRLLDISTGEEIVLATEDEGITQSNLWDISPEYAAWRAVPEGETGWDIFLHHIPTGQTSRLNTPGEHILNFYLSGTRIAWTEKRSGAWAVYSRVLPSGSEEIVGIGEWDKVLRGVEGLLVSWFDYERSECNFPCQSYDIVSKDLGSGVTRRISSSTGLWGGTTIRNCRWLLYFENDSSVSFRAYIWDVVKAGILDENCNLIPCDPDNEECAVLEWRGP